MNLKTNIMTTKEELQVKISELETTLNSLELNSKVVKDDLTEAMKNLENINKPVIDSRLADRLYELISRAFEEFDVNDYDYHCDFEIDYNNQLSVSHIEVNNIDLFAEGIHDAILTEFNVQNTEPND